MNSAIELDNNYFLKLNTITDSKCIDINKINIINILKNSKILLRIDFNNLKSQNYKKI